MRSLRIILLLALSVALVSASGCTGSATSSGYYNRGGAHRDSFPDRVYRGPQYGYGRYSRY
jgi:hypothetical protein